MRRDSVPRSHSLRVRRRRCCCQQRRNVQEIRDGQQEVDCCLSVGRHFWPHPFSFPFFFVVVFLDSWRFCGSCGCSVSVAPPKWRWISIRRRDPSPHNFRDESPQTDVARASSLSLSLSLCRHSPHHLHECSNELEGVMIYGRQHRSTLLKRETWMNLADSRKRRIETETPSSSYPRKSDATTTLPPISNRRKQQQQQQPETEQKEEEKKDGVYIYIYIIIYCAYSGCACVRVWQLRRIPYLIRGTSRSLQPSHNHPWTANLLLLSLLGFFPLPERLLQQRGKDGKREKQHPSVSEMRFLQAESRKNRRW